MAKLMPSDTAVLQAVENVRLRAAKGNPHCRGPGGTLRGSRGSSGDEVMVRHRRPPSQWRLQGAA
jgi:hypothetical protein